MKVENMPLKILNLPRQGRITLVVITSEVTSNMSITVSTLHEFQKWVMSNNFHEKLFLEELRFSVIGYFNSGGLKANIVLAHSIHNKNYMFLA